MPWSRKKWRKLSTQVSIILGLVASIPINLVTSWFQQDILSNILYSFIVMVLAVAISYSVIKMRAPLLTNAFWVLVASVSLNIFSSWIQDKVLHNSFTLLNMTMIFLLIIICL